MAETSPIPVPLRLNPPGSLHWLQWEDDYVVFDEASGLTHQLDTPTAHVLMCIEDGATDMDSLISNWGANGADGYAVRDSLLFILEQLSRANLIDTCRE